MNILPVKVVGHVPMEMFTDIQTTAQDLGFAEQFHTCFQWRPDETSPIGGLFVRFLPPCSYEPIEIFLFLRSGI